MHHQGEQNFHDGLAEGQEGVDSYSPCTSAKGKNKYRKCRLLSWTGFDTAHEDVKQAALPRRDNTHVGAGGRVVACRDTDGVGRRWLRHLSLHRNDDRLG